MTKFTCCLLLCFCFSFLSTGANAQTLTTGFEDAILPDPPPGWTVTNTGTTNWQSLGGNAYEGSQCMYLANAYNGDTSDAWLISPSFSFEAGKKYSISFYYKNQSNFSNELSVTLGSDAIPASQTEIIWQKTITTSNYTKAQINYTATETAVKHIAFHCTTPVTYTYLYIDNFSAQNVAVFAPLSAVISGVTTSTATAAWNKVEEAAKYEYGVSETMTAPSSTSVTTDTTAALTELSVARQYYFYVRTVAANGDTSSWTTTSFASAYDPAGIPLLSCGTYVENSFTGGYGLYNHTYCGTDANGKEFFHRFKPAVTADYNLVAYYSNTGQTTLFLYKDSALGTGPEDWTCIGQTLPFGSAKYSFGKLEAGKTYYIMEKTVRPIALGTSYAYWIDCYAPQPSYDSCQNAIPVASTQYTDSCAGTTLTTAGATSETPGIYLTFKATDDIQLFRFKDLVYQNIAGSTAAPQLGIEIYSASCGDYTTLVDNGLLELKTGNKTDILSYKLHKDSTYSVKLYSADNVTDLTFNLCIMKPDITPGTPGECAAGLPYVINTATDGDNTSNWVPVTDKSYKLVAAINAQGSDLNKTDAGVFVNSDTLRKDSSNVYYLDRSFTYASAKRPVAPVKIRLFISNDELNRLIAQPGSGVGSISDIRIAQGSGNCSEEITDLDSVLITPSATGNYDSTHKYVEFEVITTLSSFYLRGPGSVLPVTLLGFSASQSDDAVKVNWKTTNEVNISHYMVERSTDGRTFAALTTITASGNDGRQHDYSFTDKTITTGTYYYRLVMVDNDGTQKYSGVVPVVFSDKTRIAIVPNPFTDRITITISEKAAVKYNICITDLSGKIVQVKTVQTVAGANMQTFYLQGLPAGVYLVKITSPETTKVMKIVKE